MRHSEDARVRRSSKFGEITLDRSRGVLAASEAPLTAVTAEAHLRYRQGHSTKRLELTKHPRALYRSPWRQIKRLRAPSSRVRLFRLLLVVSHVQKMTAALAVVEHVSGYSCFPRSHLSTSRNLLRWHESKSRGMVPSSDG
jgi:hypothetical protein